AVLLAGDDDEARSAADTWARRRARFLLAPVAERTSGPAAAARLLDEPGDGDLAGLLHERGRLRLLAGRVEEGLADLRAYSARRPPAVGRRCVAQPGGRAGGARPRRRGGGRTARRGRGARRLPRRGRGPGAAPARGGQPAGGGGRRLVLAARRRPRRRPTRRR